MIHPFFFNRHNGDVTVLAAVFGIIVVALLIRHVVFVEFLAPRKCLGVLFTFGL
jgi:hypothetical protein